jgi:hypothetical protein
MPFKEGCAVLLFNRHRPLIRYYNTAKGQKGKGEGTMKKRTLLFCMVLFWVAFAFTVEAQAARLVNNGDGTVTDTAMALMWAARDNGSNMNWFNAKSYCEGYSGGGKSGWRMPTIDELKALHAAGNAGEVISLTGTGFWASETNGSLAADVNFYDGQHYWFPQSFNALRALPVRDNR